VRNDFYAQRRREERRLLVYSKSMDYRKVDRQADAKKLLAVLPSIPRRRDHPQYWTLTQDMALCRAIASGVPSSDLPKHVMRSVLACESRFGLIRPLIKLCNQEVEETK